MPKVSDWGMIEDALGKAHCEADRSLSQIKPTTPFEVCRLDGRFLKAPEYEKTMPVVVWTPEHTGLAVEREVGCPLAQGIQRGFGPDPGTDLELTRTLVHNIMEPPLCF